MPKTVSDLFERLIFIFFLNSKGLKFADDVKTLNEIIQNEFDSNLDWSNPDDHGNTL